MSLRTTLFSLSLLVLPALAPSRAQSAPSPLEGTWYCHGNPTQPMAELFWSASSSDSYLWRGERYITLKGYPSDETLNAWLLDSRSTRSVQLKLRLNRKTLELAGEMRQLDSMEALSCSRFASLHS